MENKINNNKKKIHPNFLGDLKNLKTFASSKVS